MSGVCQPSAHYRVYYITTLSVSEVTAKRFNIGRSWIWAAALTSSNELQSLDNM